MKGAAAATGQRTRPAAICASVRLPTRLLEKQPPGRPLNSAMLDTNDGEP